MNPLRVAFVRSNYPTYEPRALNYISTLEKFNPTVIVWNRTSTPEKGKKWLMYDKPTPFGLRSIASLPGWWKFVYTSLRSESPTIVQACNIESCIPVSFYCIIHRKKFIYDIWDTTGGMFGSNSTLFVRFLNTIDRFFIMLSAGFFVPDEERFTQLNLNAKKVKKPFLIVPNSQVFTKTEKTIINFGNTKVKLLYVGTLVKDVRGLEMLITASKSNPMVHLDIAGYGPDEEFFRSMCKDSGASCTFHGPATQDEAYKLNSSCDIIVTLLSPDFENYKFATSTKIFEAFSENKPVITTKNTASGTLVAKTQWGYVIDYTQDALNQLLSTITNTSTSIELDPSRISKYNWTTVAAKIQDFYERIARS